MKTKTDKARIKRAWKYRAEARVCESYESQVATIKRAIQRHRHCRLCANNLHCEIIKKTIHYFYGIGQEHMAANVYNFMGPHCKNYQK